MGLLPTILALIPAVWAVYYHLKFARLTRLRAQKMAKLRAWRKTWVYAGRDQMKFKRRK